MEKEEEYGWDTFHTAAFGGFRKDEVLEYLDSLTEELEQLRKSKKELEQELADKGSQLEQEKRSREKLEQLLDESERERAEVEASLKNLDARTGEYDKLKTELGQLRKERTDNKRLQMECEQLQQERKALRQSLAELESRAQNNETEEYYRTLCRELEERIDTYEKREAAISQVLVDAKVQAEHILSDADSRADQIIRQANHQAELQKRNSELMVQRAVAQNIGQIKLIKQQLQEYLEILGNVYQGVEQARNSLSRSVLEIPEDLEMLQRIAEREIVLESDSYRMDDIAP